MKKWAFQGQPTSAAGFTARYAPHGYWFMKFKSHARERNPFGEQYTK